MLDGPDGSLRPIIHIQFPEDVLYMFLGRLDADSKGSADFAIAQSDCNVLKDLPFALRERNVHADILTRPTQSRLRLHQQTVARRRLALHGQIDRRDERFDRLILGDKFKGPHGQSAGNTQ